MTMASGTSEAAPGDAPGVPEEFLYGEAQWSYFPAAIARSSWSLSSQLRFSFLGPTSIGIGGRMQPNANEFSAQLYAYY